MSVTTKESKGGNGAAPVKLGKKDFESDQDVRWCPGCGDYAILSSVQRTLAKLGVRRENSVFVSGIGCSSRFPYYMQTYGFHSIHGRAPAIATGLKVARPDLDVWVITGDGDGLSIGGNHLLHVLRRNVDLQILLFNNKIYGLTKGQYSPTSPPHTRTPSSPMGSIDEPVNPVSVAIGANASFVARVVDTDAKSFMTILERAHAHKGTAFVEIMQNCPVFNDGVWADVSTKKTALDRQLKLVQGEPLLFGKNKDKGIRMGKGFRPEVVEVGDGEGQVSIDEIIVHDEEAPASYAFMLGQMHFPECPVPVGVLRAEQRPTYDKMTRDQVAEAVESKGRGELANLLNSGMTWEVMDDGTIQ